MPNLRTALRQLASEESDFAPIAAAPKREEPAVQASPPYDCIRCRRPVVLELRGNMYLSRCSCGNRSKVALVDYDKLRAFDVMRAAQEDI